MVGSAVETEHNSRDDRKRDVHIERMTSENLRPFLDDTMFVWTTFSSVFDASVTGRLHGAEEGIPKSSVGQYSDENREPKWLRRLYGGMCIPPPLGNIDVS